MDQNLSINKFTAAIKLTLSDKTSISDSDLKKEIEVIKQKIILGEEEIIKIGFSKWGPYEGFIRACKFYSTRILSYKHDQLIDLVKKEQAQWLLPPSNELKRINRCKLHGKNRRTATDHTSLSNPGEN
jgi:hypothetical protein